MGTILYTDHLKLFPISQPPETGELTTALILVIADEETEPLVHLADETYEYRHGQWYGELSGARLPRGATWYLPERALCAVPQAVVARRVAPDRGAEAPAPVGTLPPAVLALLEERN
ncbi:MAG: hypothetical protein IPG66_05700 [Hydrogenophilales bacterium]|nr:hypothetical protein [Hydrogenophilales bacterium]